MNQDSSCQNQPLPLKQENNQPLFCASAFGSISINASGQYQPCCTVVNWLSNITNDVGHPAENINHPSLVDVRKKLANGEWPEYCLNCKIPEEAGGVSMRLSWNTALEEYNIPMNEIINPRDVVRLDLALGSKCNSKCMTCNATASSLWVEENQYIWGKHLSNPRLAISNEELNLIDDAFPNIKSIGFVGGEPTIINEHLDFLKRLVDSGKSKDIEVGYVTNLTGLSHELIDQWKNFKRINIAVSIDGVGKVNDYIRFPIPWGKVERNLRKYLELTKEEPSKFLIGLSATLSIFNIRGINDLVNFWDNTTSEYDVSSVININKVWQPEYADPWLLPLEYRLVEAEKLKETYNSWQNRKSKKPHFGRFLALINWLESPQIKDDFELNKTKVFIQSSDRYRKRDIKNFLPELYEELFK